MTILWKLTHIFMAVIAPILWIGNKYQLFTSTHSLSFVGIMVAIFIAVAAIVQLAGMVKEINNPYFKALIMTAVVLIPLFIVWYGLGAIEQNIADLTYSIAVIIIANIIAAVPLTLYYRSKQSDEQVETTNNA